MRSLDVIVEHPLVYELVHVGQQAKQVGVEQFAAKRTVEAFNIDVLSRLARLNPVQGNTLLLTPLAQTGADKLGPVVSAQLRGRP